MAVALTFLHIILSRKAHNLEVVGESMTNAGYMPSKVVVPQPVQSLTTKSVLVMEFLEVRGRARARVRCARSTGARA